MLDMRKSRIHRRHREKFLCSVCPAVSKNRMICVHETVGLDGIADCRDLESNYLDRSLDNTRNSAIDEWDSAVKIEYSGDSTEEDMAEVLRNMSYTSIKLRIFLRIRRSCFESNTGNCTGGD